MYPTPCPSPRTLSTPFPFKKVSLFCILYYPLLSPLSPSLSSTVSTRPQSTLGGDILPTQDETYCPLETVHHPSRGPPLGLSDPERRSARPPQPLMATRINPRPKSLCVPERSESTPCERSGSMRVKSRPIQLATRLFSFCVASSCALELGPGGEIEGEVQLSLRVIGFNAFWAQWMVTVVPRIVALVWSKVD